MVIGLTPTPSCAFTVTADLAKRNGVTTMNQLTHLIWNLDYNQHPGVCGLTKVKGHAHVFSGVL